MHFSANHWRRHVVVKTRCLFLVLMMLVPFLVMEFNDREVRASSYALTREELQKMFLSVAEQEDVFTLGAGLTNYVETLYAAQSELAWSSSVPIELFKDYVIPVRFNPSYQIATAYYYPEKIEDWRSRLYPLAKQIIGGENNIEKVTSLLHRWVNVNIPYLAVDQPMYLQPSLILDKKGGSCWHNAILLAAFYRSIMLPARVVVGAFYGSSEITATGKATLSKDLDIVVMESFWISRDWKIWEKEFRVYDETIGSYLKSDEYSTNIVTIDAAGKERLTLTIPFQKALDHVFTVSFRFIAPQGHEWVELLLPSRGWIAVDGTSRDGYDCASQRGTDFFDIQAYNPSKKAWNSSYFFYRSRNPLRMLMATAKSILSESRSKLVERDLLEKDLDEAYGVYRSSVGRELSSDEKQRIGEKIFKLCGDVMVKCLSEDMKAVFFNIWDSTVKTPQAFASALMSNGISNWGTILPYDVFDFSLVKGLYVDAPPPRRDPPYCNEVKREYFWLDSTRKSLSFNMKMFIMMLGYDHKSRSWKCTVTAANSYTPLEGISPDREFSELMFLGQKPDGSADDWLNQTPIILDTKGDSKNNSPNSDIKAVCASADKNYLYVMIQVWGKPDPGNNYIFPLDLHGDGRWDYSFGFNRNSAWMYDLRNVPKGQWPTERLSSLDVSFGIDEVAEIAIPLDIIDFPTTIRMMLWIYYPKQGITTDETDWGAVPFSPTSSTVTVSTTKTSSSAASQSTKATPTVTTTTSSLTAQFSDSATVYIVAAAIVLIAAIAGLLASKRSKKTKR